MLCWQPWIDLRSKARTAVAVGQYISGQLVCGQTSINWHSHNRGRTYIYIGYWLLVLGYWLLVLVYGLWLGDDSCFSSHGSCTVRDASFLDFRFSSRCLAIRALVSALAL